MVRIAFFVLFLLNFVGLFGQELRISKYIPGDFRMGSDAHRVELYNSGSVAVDLTLWMLVTRDYSVRFPRGTVIPARSVFVISTKKTASNGVNLGLMDAQDFLFKAPDRSVYGNFVVLVAKNGKKIDGMYFHSKNSIPFLPDRGFCITQTLDSIPYYIPEETNRFWNGRRLIMRPDPAICCFLSVGGAWVASSRKTNLVPAVRFAEVEANYFDGIVTIGWGIDFEADSKDFVVQKKLGNAGYRDIAVIESEGESNGRRDYEFYDSDLQKGEKVTYRIVNRDIFGNEILSEEREIVADDSPEEFALSIVGEGMGQSESISIRFSSLVSAPVRIRLFDERHRQLAIVFEDYVTAESQNLVKLNSKLPVGKYRIIADLPTKRYHKEFTTGE